MLLFSSNWYGISLSKASLMVVVLSKETDLENKNFLSINELPAWITEQP